jgi:hypothetical protein
MNYRTLPLLSLGPPATLSVVPSTDTETHFLQVPIHDWTSASWGPPPVSPTLGVIPDGVNPSSLVRKIAAETAQQMDVVPLRAPTPNSSYILQFFGPSLQCLNANSSQQPAFDSYTRALAEQTDTFTLPLLETAKGITTPYVLLFSADSSTFFNGDQPQYNGDQFPAPFNISQIPQIWVQTGNRSIVCTLVNSSFNVAFEFRDSIQTIYELEVQVVNEVSTYSTCYGVTCAELSAYFAIFLSWTNMLNGNVTMYPSFDGWSLVDVSSNVLITGLAACNDIAHNCWNSLSLQKATAFHIPNVTDNNFPEEPWMCRNRTIDRGIEDFANNVTMSMLSSSALT